MDVSEESAAEALKFVEEVFDRVETVLQKQKFLSGSTIGCLDINFGENLVLLLFFFLFISHRIGSASLAAVVILPPEMPLYHALFERLEDNHAVKVAARSFRERPAGQHVLHIYQRFRRE